ncbi:MAG: excinuclease ABC subunit A [Crocinitomicaceae bacterium]|nr:excinuclease ABC subunit A [Crocinitomicaceae bacterium]
MSSKKKGTQIEIRGARMHNLKGVDVDIPKNKLTVITGLSGSGKSSLAFDTLYAEGHRRYVESLSSYARQFLGRLDKPLVDSIAGLSPAIAIEQRTSAGGPRSTVGTRTEIHDYLRILFARIGRTFSPVSGKEVKRDRVTNVVDFVLDKSDEVRFMIVAPLHAKEDRTTEQQLKLLNQQGFSRILVNGDAQLIEDVLKQKKISNKLDLVVDRMTVSTAKKETSRLADSIETAFFEGAGDCSVIFPFDNTRESFNNRFERDDLVFIDPRPDLFSFNSPDGACPTCEGFGSTLGIDPEKVVPDTSKSIFSDAVMPWRSDRMKKWKDNVILGASIEGIDIHKPWCELSEEEKCKIWDGTKSFKGLYKFFEYIENKSYKIQYRVMLSRYRGRTVCPDCGGSRIRKEASYVKIDGVTMPQLLSMPLSNVFEHFKNINLTKTEKEVSNRLLKEICERLKCLCDLGLGYLTLMRPSNSLSGGESQRIVLSTCLGSALVGSTYVLDEPSIGLHPEDTKKLINVLQNLRNLGNTVVVVEHDDEIIKSADHIVDMGPMAGSFGGEVVYSGPSEGIKSLSSDHPSITASYLSKRSAIELSKKERNSKDKISIIGARVNNLKNINVDFPLRKLVAVTGVSGSGKSTLVSDLLVPAVKAAIEGIPPLTNGFTELIGDFSTVQTLEHINQNPIGKSSRSCPITYVKGYDEIRALLSSTSHAKARGLKPYHFSFNVAGGRCEDCEGEGTITVGMQFMADLKLKCDTCDGKRFQDHILDINYKGKNIYDILSMTVEDALIFFKPEECEKVSTTIRKLLEKIQPLYDVGLGYVSLGQGSNTLSGGEAQRIKLATFLSRGSKQGHTLFVFDEPTTGLHIHDVAKLLESFERLIAQGHSIIVIEHQLDVIANSDYVIDLGPEGGEKGGNLVVYGTPNEITKCKHSLTGKHLANKK